MRYIKLFTNISNWWVHFTVKFGLSGIDPVIFKLPNDITVEVPRRLLTEFKEITMDECYTRHLNSSIVRKQPTIIDIGANAGFFTIFIASKFPEARILAFEPIPKNYQLLKKNRELNRKLRIDCQNLAVCGYSGKVTISFEEIDSLTTSASIDRSEFHNESLAVDCLSLEDIFKNYSLDECDFMKVDCEGAEYQIIYNCPPEILKKVSQMVLEVHQGAESDHNIDSLENFMRSNGFVTRRYSLHMLFAWRRGRLPAGELQSNR